MTDEEVMKGIAHDLAVEYAAKVAVAKGYKVALLVPEYIEAYQKTLAQLRKIFPPDMIQVRPKHV